MARIFIYDGREFPDPDASKTPEEIKRMMSDFFPEVANADVKEHKKEDGSIAYEFIRKVGTKGSWKAEVLVAGEKDFVSSAVRLATKEEAESYAFDLAMRWLAVKDWRVVESDEEVNYRMQNGELVSCGGG